MSEKHKKVSKVLNYFEHLLVFVSAVGGCVSISAFTPSLCVLVGFDISEEGINICTITAGKSISQSSRKKEISMII